MWRTVSSLSLAPCPLLTYIHTEIYSPFPQEEEGGGGEEGKPAASRKSFKN